MMTFVCEEMDSQIDDRCICLKELRTNYKTEKHNNSNNKAILWE